MSVNSSVSPAQRRTSPLKIRSVTPARGACSTSGPMVAAVLTTILPALLVLPLAAGGLRAEPRQVILVRHADKDVDRGDFNLSPAGLLRAIRLGRLLPACFGPVERLGSYGFNPGSQKNARSYQTAVPLAVATGLPIRLFSGGEDDSPAAPADLRQDPWLAGRSVVLVWEHRRLPALAAELGWKASNQELCRAAFRLKDDPVFSGDEAAPAGWHTWIEVTGEFPRTLNLTRFGRRSETDPWVCASLTLEGPGEASYIRARDSLERALLLGARAAGSPGKEP